MLLYNHLHVNRKRACYVGGGLSHHCAAQLINAKMNMHDWLMSGDSPGKKRSAGSADNALSAAELDR